MNRSVVHNETVETPNAMKGRRRLENAFPKKCSCGAIYHEPDWASLPFHGIFRGTDETAGRQLSRDLEIRSCVCGSSMAVELKEINMKRLLITSYWIGIVADAAATVMLFSPAVANAILQPPSFPISPFYLYVSRVAGALMLGWTVLLFWAQRKPVERADILLITLLPVVTLLAGAAFIVARSGQISVVNLTPMFILYVMLFCTYIPSYLWAKKQIQY